MRKKQIPVYLVVLGGRAAALLTYERRERKKERKKKKERKGRQQTKNLKFISENRKCSQRLQISEKTS